MFSSSRFSLTFLFFTTLSGAQASSHQHQAVRTDGGLHLPIFRRDGAGLYRRGSETGAIGLGDVLDVTYNVLIAVGDVETPVVLDTGSSDLWVISNACKENCTTGVPLYPIASFQSTGLVAHLQYGDSYTGTHAIGPIGTDTVGLAGLSLQNQYFAAINDTNTSVSETGSAGIFGLGFPMNSVIWNQVYSSQSSSSTSSKRSYLHQSFWRRALSHMHNFAIRIFPDLTFSRPTSSFSSSSSRSPEDTPAVLASFDTDGPFLSRLVASAELSAPMFTITLQRETIDVGGNLGQLSLGELPASVKNESLTWVSVRGYTPSEGGLAPPADAPNEVYPITWEIPLDDVFFDGQKLPRSNLSSSNITLSALLDTGNSLIRGPQDVMDLISSSVGADNFGQISCAHAYNLSFQIGGNMFAVDPRDFLSQSDSSSADCTPNLAATDPPGDGFLYSWSLGDPFLKSVLASFYYGNLTYPSTDPPRIGLLSTVSSDASSLLQAAVSAAAAGSGNLPSESQSAPSGTFTAASTNSEGVPQATETLQVGHSNGSPQAARLAGVSRWTVVAVVSVFIGCITS